MPNSSLTGAPVPSAEMERSDTASPLARNASVAPDGILPSSPKASMAIFILLAVMAVVSTGVALREAVTSGIDFQWSGAHLLSLHQDPWKTYIHGDPDKQIILGQQPNYLHEFYVILLPLGAMPFEVARAVWCAINLVLLAAVLKLVSSLFRLDTRHFILLALLTLSSTPFRVTMSNGQNGIFILFMFTLLYYLQNRGLKGLALGLSYSKYSFSPLLVLVLLFKKRFDLFLISLVLPSIGLLITWFMLGGSIKELAFEPLKTSKIAMGPGFADIMTPLEIGLRHMGISPGLTYLVPTLIGLSAAVVAAFLIARSRTMSERIQFAVVITLTLLCFKHVLYDFVVLIVPAAAAITAINSRARTIALLCMAYFWFGTTIVGRLYPGLHAATVVFSGAVLLTLAISTAWLEPRTVPAEPLEPGHPSDSSSALATA